ncbi:MAG: transporter substrate-binding domain-containing protein [Vicinamibacterales bacterium]
MLWTASFIALAMLCVRVSGQPAAPDQPRAWLFVADRDYPPLSYVDNGVPQGLDLDLARELGRVLGREIRVELLDFVEAQRRVLAGEADAVSDLGVTPERRQQFDLSEGTVTHEYGLFVRRGDTSVRGIRDLSGKRVGVTPAPVARLFLQEQSDAQLVVVGDFDEGFRRLVAGELDVVAFDTWVAAPKARAFARDVALVGVPFVTSATAIAVRRGNQAVLSEINRGLRQLKQDGTLHQLEERWRPREMVFLSETLVQRVVGWTVLGLLVLLLAGAAYWVAALKRQMRERRRAEAALEASEERFEKAFRASPHGIAIIDSETRRYVEVNDRFLRVMGFTREELIGRTGGELQMTTNPAAGDAAAEQVARHGFAHDIEFQVRTKNGRVLTVLGSGERIEVAGRRSSLWVFRDVTEERELEARLRQAQKMDAVGRLAAGVAHDFNNLLTVILGNCEVGLSVVGPDEPLCRTLDDIRAAADRASALTRQLLAFSRRTIVQLRVFDLNDAVREIQPMLARLIGEDVAVSMVLDPDAGHLEADPAQLQQVLLNLAVNARDAMPGGGRLEFRTKRETIGPESADGLGAPAGDYVLLEVADTGVGIDPDTCARIFEPFFTTKERGHGAGLGLAMVHGIVTGAGGTVDVQSQPGHGTTFRIRWPRRGGVAATADAVARTALPPSAGRERVVLVEDEQDVRDLLQAYLARLGYDVLAAGTGEEALARCAQDDRKPDLLVTDVVMSGMNGREVAEEMRSRYPELSVLYLSGYTDDTVLRRGVSLSQVRFLQKPFEMAAFASTVRRILDETVPK